MITSYSSPYVAALFPLVVCLACGVSQFTTAPAAQGDAPECTSIEPRSAATSSTTTPTATGLSEYERSRRLLDEATAAIGGRAALAAIVATSFSYAGHTVAVGQSMRPDTEPLLNPVQGRFVSDPNQRRLYSESETVFSGGIRFAARRGIDGDTGYDHRIGTDAYTKMTAFDLRFARTSPFSNPELLLPHGLLWTALNNPSSVRGAEVAPDQTARFDFATRDGQVVTMVLGEDWRPVRAEVLAGVPGVGDTWQSFDFGDYRQVGDVMVPHVVSFSTGDRPAGQWTLRDVELSDTPEPSLFAWPTGAKASEYAPSYQPKAVGDGVFAVRLHSGFGGSYNAMFVVFADHVVVVEAPLVDALSEVMLGIIAAVAPGKPVRSVVVTHYHHDHTGGLAAYVRHGASVYTTANNRDFVSRMVTVRSTLAPGSAFAEANDKEPIIEIVERERTLRDATRTLRLFDVGPNPHVDEMLVAYEPASRVLFVSDLFTPSVNGAFGPPSPALLAFARALDELDLDIVTIVPGHGPVVPFSEFARARMVPGAKSGSPASTNG